MTGTCERDTPQVFNSTSPLKHQNAAKRDGLLFLFLWFFSVMATVSSYFMVETGKFLPPSSHLQADLQHFLTNHSIYQEQWGNPDMHSINDLSHRYWISLLVLTSGNPKKSISQSKNGATVGGQRVQSENCQNLIQPSCKHPQFSIFSHYVTEATKRRNNNIDFDCGL